MRIGICVRIQVYLIRDAEALTLCEITQEVLIILANIVISVSNPEDHTVNLAGRLDLFPIYLFLMFRTVNNSFCHFCPPDSKNAESREALSQLFIFISSVFQLPFPALRLL